MNQEQLSPDGVFSAPPEPEGENILKLAHRGLRGHYLKASLIGAALALIGGFAGFMAAEPEYVAEGLVQVAAELPKLLNEIDENTVPPNFDMVVNTEASYLDSRRVLESAASDEELKEAGWPVGAEAIDRLDRSITVVRRRNEQIITVEGRDPNPVLAQRAVNAVLTEYEALCTERQERRMTTKEQNLKIRVDDLGARIKTLNEQIRQAESLFAVPDLDQLLHAKVETYLAQEAQIAEYKAALDRKQDKPAAPNVAPIDEPVTLRDDESLAMYDTDFGTLLTKRSEVTARLTSARQRYGPSHHEVEGLEWNLAELQDRIAERRNIVLRKLDSGQITLSMPEVAVVSQEILDTLIAEHEKLQEYIAEIRLAQFNIRDLKYERDWQQAERDRAANALEQLLVERPIILQSGRITITRALTPVQPSSDRRYQLGVMGAVAGFGLPFGILWLLSLLRPSLRYLDDLDHAKLAAPIVGTLPNLSGSRSDNGDSELASLSVHHIRNTLRLCAVPTRAQSAVYAVTSAGPRDGKTSLLIALGASFAAERLRTIMIDVDLVGRGLSAAFQLHERCGLTEAIQNPDAPLPIESTEIPGLSVLSAGLVGALRPEEISRGDLQRIVNRLRSSFDVILIDTGPLSGSLEANLVVTVADEVVVAVPRGQSPKIVNATIERIGRLRGHCAGIVFNRACATDVRSGSSQFVFKSQSQRSSQAASRTDQSAREPRLLMSAMLDQAESKHN